MNDCFNKKFAEIENMYIEEFLRGFGIGSRLVDEFKKYCQNNNIELIKVSAWSNNLDAINFYKKNKFEDYETIHVCNLK